MTNDEIQELARSRLKTLSDGLTALRTWQQSRVYNQFDSYSETKLKQESEQKSAVSFNKLKLELSRSVEEVTKVMTSYDGREVNIVFNATLVHGYNAPFLALGINVLESAIGEWERIEREPARYKKPEVPPTNPPASATSIELSTVPTSELAARSPEPDKITIGQIVRALTPGQAVTIVGVLATVLGGAFWGGYTFHGLKDSVQLEHEKEQLRKELEAARQQLKSISEKK
jgi:hypothetical protein